MKRLGSATIIRNGRVIDPANKRDETADLYIADGKVVGSKSEIKNAKSEIEEIDAKGVIVAPGLIDMHVHLREPGFSHKETIESGARAAAHRLHAEYVAGPGQSQHDCVDQRSGLCHRARECFANWRNFKKSRGRRTRSDRVARAGGHRSDYR